MALLFCHECGVELPISNQDGVCSGCRSLQSEAQYTVRALDGGHYGPMPHHRVIEQLERGFHSAQDLVSRGGGQSVAIEEHVDFAAYFIEGDSRSRQLRDTVRRRKRKQGKRQRQALLVRALKGLVVVSLSGAAFWYLPDIAILGQRLISLSTSEDSVSEVGETDGEPTRVRSRIETLLRQLEERHSSGEGERATANVRRGTIEADYERAWSYLLGGQPQEVAMAVEFMERVLVSSAGEAWALSALIFAKSAHVENSEEALGEIQELISILGEVETESGEAGAGGLSETWESELAFAALARQSGVWHEAAVHSERCLGLRPDEPACAWIGAEAWAESGDYDRAIEVLAPALTLWPSSTELQLIQARALFGKGDHLAAYDIIEHLEGEFTGSDQQHLGLLEVSADYQMSVGDFQSAIQSYEQMLALGASDAAVHYRLGRLRLQVEHDYQGAFELLQPIAENGAGNIDRVLHASHAARMVGEYELALSYASAAAETRREWGPGVLAQAMALDAMGRTDEVAGVFRRVRIGSLSGHEAASFYIWVANFYNRQELGRLATNAHGEVERYDENSGELVVSKLELSLFVGGKASVVNILSEIHLLDLEAAKMASPLVDIWYPESDFTTLAIEVAALFAQDPAMTPVFDRTVGLAGIFDCLNGSNCSRVIHHLNLALERDGTDVAALAGLGRVYYSQGQFFEATRFLQRALGEAGDSPVLQSMYGDSLWRVGRQPEAEVAFQQAMHTSGTSSVAARRYALALAEWGRLDEAAELGARALLLDENDTETLRLLVAAGVAVE